jgi:8-oxo-dGTP pyrophosphatase MutT (NUDIX family)
MISSFNVRVYGLLIQNKKVLITDEHRSGILMTKFPGGGLEFGEGIKDCLIREFQEELGVKINVRGHFYTNDFLQLSAFNEKDQLLSLYYFVETAEMDKIPPPILKEKLSLNEQGFRWVNLSALEMQDFTFPIDKIVANKLKIEMV